MSSPEYLDHARATWLVGDLPLVITCGQTPSNAALRLPDALPFTLEVDPLSGTIRQQRSAAVEQALRAGYGEGAVISGSMDDAGLGQRYAGDFLAYVERVIPSLDGKRILEIGCGTGYLLSLLRDRGATVVGIEPGPQGKVGAQRFGVRVVQGSIEGSTVQPMKEVANMTELSRAYERLQTILSNESDRERKMIDALGHSPT